MATVPINPTSAGSLSRYLWEVHRFPLLSAEEELELARRWRDRHDVDAATRLVTSHLRLVSKVAMGYRGYGLPVGELIGEGNVGMMRAIQRFDPDRGVRLATFAMCWIRASMQEYVVRSWSLVRIGTTVAQKKLFFNLPRLKRNMHVFDDADLTAEQVSGIASTLAVPANDVITMNRRLAGREFSLNAPTSFEDGSEAQDMLVDTTISQETDIAEREELAGRRALLPAALTILNERERHILSERRLKDKPMPLEALSRHYGISRERARQIEVRAFAKLQKEMRMQASLQRTSCAGLSADRRSRSPSLRSGVTSA
jgi:RNA polymerase sigma-32 factor